MTAAEPLSIPGLPLPRLLTAAEYAQLGETGWGYTELMEGRILVSPSPTAKHNLAGFALARHLHPQLPDTVLRHPERQHRPGAGPADQPGSVRRPDLVVVNSKAINRVDRDGGLLGAARRAHRRGDRLPWFSTS